MASLTVSQVSARFATMWANFSNDDNGLRIENAFPAIPRILNAALLPAVIPFPGNGVYTRDRYGEAIIGETRSYRCVLYVSSATMGNIQTGQTDVEGYFTPVRNYFAARPGMEDDTESAPKTVVAKLDILNDEGYIMAEYPIGINDTGQFTLGLFHAIAFNFEVHTFDTVTYKD
jgi:hypothetical protein